MKSNIATSIQSGAVITLPLMEYKNLNLLLLGRLFNEWSCKPKWLAKDCY